jgi:hypothetical protein
MCMDASCFVFMSLGTPSQQNNSSAAAWFFAFTACSSRFASLSAEVDASLATACTAAIVKVTTAKAIILRM